MSEGRDPEQAAFYRAALLLGLVRGDVVVAWADSALSRAPDVPPAFVEISTTDPTDITALRHALLGLCDETISEEIARGLLGLIGNDLSSGRRGYDDSKRVLRQMRSLLKLPRVVDEEIKAWSVRSYEAKPEDASAVETRIREWLSRQS